MSAEILVNTLNGAVTQVNVTDSKGQNYKGELDGENYKIKIPEYGKCTVYITINNEIINQEVSIDICKQYQVSAFDSNLNNNSWNIISLASSRNLASSIWSVGSQKEIIINGTVGTVQLNNLKTSVYILGFNHNAEREGNNLTHFGAFKINDVSVALYDAGYGSWSDDTQHFIMGVLNGGGWRGSTMRKTILDSEGVLSNAPTLLNALPKELKQVLKKCAKWSDNVGDYSSNKTNMSATQDYLWLLSEVEIADSDNASNPYCYMFQKQYDYFKTSYSSRVFKYKYDKLSEAIHYWSREPARYSDAKFVSFKTDLEDSIATSAAKNKSLGLAPCFCV